MARPKKNNADYFSHDKDMRDDRKIKALRSKYGILGYGVYCMLLEYLTGAEDNELVDEEIEIELIAGDFGVSVTEMTDIMDYCCRLKLLVRENGVFYSKSLKDRLAPVYEKRNRARVQADVQSRSSGKFVTETTDITTVSVTETPQSKVKESKVNYISILLNNEERSIFNSLEPLMNEFLSNDIILQDFQRHIGAKELDPVKEKIKEFFVKLTVDGEKSKDRKDAIYHFKSWYTTSKEIDQAKTHRTAKKVPISTHAAASYNSNKESQKKLANDPRW